MYYVVCTSNVSCWKYIYVLMHRFSVLVVVIFVLIYCRIDKMLK